MKKSIFTELLFSITVILATLSSLSAAAFSADPSVSAAAPEVAAVRSRINAKKALWTARETSMTKMSEHERKIRSSGLRFRNMSIASNGTAYRKSSAASAAVPLTVSAPDSGISTPSVYLAAAPSGGFDWRSNGGTNYTTPVRDQGNCGSCWAFSAAGTLESYSLIHSTYDGALNLAEQILVSCSGAGSCSGGYLASAANYIQGTGLPVENIYPYIAVNGTCSNAVAGWKSLTIKIGSWSEIVNGNASASTVATIKDAIYTYGPVSAAFLVYSDFNSYDSGVYTHTGGTYLGGHAIVVVGYTDDTSIPGGGYFICKNSWGTGWGEGFGNQPGGYFRIAYSEVTSPVRFGIEVIAYNTTACTFVLGETSSAVPYTSGTGNVSVTTGGSTCIWMARSDQSWLTLSQQYTLKSGDGSISYTTAANTTANSRTATIYLMDRNGNNIASDIITQPASSLVTYTLSGAVKNGTSVVAGAKVTLAGKTATTSSTGSYSITGLLPGTYTLGATAPGFVAYKNAAFVLKANQTATIPIVKIPYTLTGTVLSGVTGSPLPGATVVFGAKTTTTDTAGSFSIPGTIAGTYPLTISAVGYTTVTNTAYAFTGNQTFNSTLSPITYTLSGAVKNGTFVVAGAKVTLAGKTATTSSTGSYSITGLLPGTYTLGATAPGFVAYKNAAFVLKANQTATIPIVKIPYTLTGTVLSGVTGSPLPGATVVFGAKTTTTDTAGSFSIPGTIAGTYPLTISAVGYTTVTNTAYAFTGNQTFNSTLSPITYTLSGAVKNGTFVVAGAKVTLAGKTATTSSTGSYSITGLLPGTYTLGATAPGFVAYKNVAFVLKANQTATIPLVTIP